MAECPTCKQPVKPQRFEDLVALFVKERVDAERRIERLKEERDALIACHEGMERRAKEAEAEVERMKGDGDEICADCQLPVGRGIGTYWRASDALWGCVVGSPPDPALILCPCCFSDRAQSKGISLDGWVPGADAEQALPAELERKDQEIANLRATAHNVIAAWDNQSPGAEKWDRLREKIDYLRAAL